MINVLKSDMAKVELTSLGAELISFVKLGDDCEYVWIGDKNYWSSHAPILFPIVCAVNEGKIKVEGKEYEIGNHGFAKKSEFEVIDAKNNYVVYKLSYNEETMKMYPFKFNLYVTYTLVENKLMIDYKVENIDDKTIYFQLGTHPGFNCPLTEDEDFNDYYIEFECNETLERLFLSKPNVIIKDKSEKIILQNEKVLPLTNEMFNEGALVFRNINSKKISLKSNKSDKKVIVSFDNLPNLGIWKAKNAPFVCIEPWYGIADTEGFNWEFKEKEMIIDLDPKKEFKCAQTIEIL